METMESKDTIKKSIHKYQDLLKHLLDEYVFVDESLATEYDIKIHETAKLLFRNERKLTFLN